LPFYPQFDAGDDYQAIVGSRSPLGYGKYNTQMLPFFCMAFHGIFGVRMSVGLAFPVVDLSFFQYLPDLFFGDMPAFHTTAGMMGEYQMADMTIDRPSLNCLGRRVPLPAHGKGCKYCPTGDECR